MVDAVRESVKLGRCNSLRREQALCNAKLTVAAAHKKMKSPTYTCGCGGIGRRARFRF